MKRSSLLIGLFIFPALLCADQVIMKDGTVYKGKIQVDTDKAILIGNPPFDPQSYLLEAKDIDKIIYEEYKPQDPSVRKRGFVFESRLGMRVFSGNELELKPAPVTYFGIGFRVHPMLELNGGMDWNPSLSVKDDFAVSNGTTTRHYQDLSQMGFGFAVRFYPLVQKPWKTEPYVTAGYQWSKISFKSTEDNLKGAGWTIGVGAIRPVTRHVFLESRLAYEKLKFDTVNFLGQKSGISPSINQKAFVLQIGASYRL